MPPENIKSISFDLDYIQLQSLDSNRGEEVVIALHGFLDNANSMIDLASAFPSHRFIALDLAGHGQSGHRPAGAHYNQMDYVQDLHQVISQLDVENVILLGHSLGGILASIYAAAFPERVKAVISIDAFGPLTEKAESTTSQIRLSLEPRMNKMVEGPAKQLALEKAVKARAATTDLSEPLCRKILTRNTKKDAQGGEYWSSDPRLRTKSWYRMTQEQASTLLKDIQCPVLVLAASNSFKSLPEALRERGEWIQALTFEMLDGGHHIHLERPEETCSLIVRFMGELPA